MKVVHLITGLKVGGAEKMLLRTIPSLAGKHIVCSIIPKATIGEQLQAMGVSVVYLNLRSFFDIRILWRLWRLLRAERPDIITTYLLHADILGRIVGKLAGVPVIISSFRCAHQDKPILVWLNRLTVPLITHGIAVSQAVADWAQHRLHLPQNKITVIHNGLDTQEVTNTTINAATSTSRPFTITYIGRLDPQKSPEYLLQAVASLPANLRQHTTVLCAGDGPIRADLEHLSQQLGLTSTVQFLGFRSDVANILARTDIFVSPTQFEGISNAIMEAMAAGKAVITTDIPENRELIQNGINGMLVPVSDSIVLAHTIQQLSEDPLRRSQLGQAAQRTIKNQFSLNRTIGQLNTLYQRFTYKAK